MHHHKDHHPVIVLVNGHHVKMHEREATGLRIKEAAIAQGVQIHGDFALFEKREHQPLIPIGDHDTIRLHEHEHFRAVAPDDNS